MESKNTTSHITAESLSEALQSLDQMLKIHMKSVQSLLVKKPTVLPPALVPAIKGKHESKLIRKQSMMTGIDLLKEITKKTFQIRTDQVRKCSKVYDQHVCLCVYFYPVNSQTAVPRFTQFVIHVHLH